jgi:hypothetical protein
MILQAEQQQTARHAGRVHMNGFARPMDNIEKWITFILQHRRRCA